VLEEAGKSFERTSISRTSCAIRRDPAGTGHIDAHKIERNFSLVVKKVNEQRKEMQIRLQVKTRNEDTGEFRTDDAEFWVGLLTISR